MPNGRCRMHGGASLSGVASPRWKHGRYSKCVPKNLRGDYLRAVNDPELLSLKDGLALLDARMRALLRRMAESEPPPWGRAIDALTNYKTAKPEDKPAAFARLERVMREGWDAKEREGALWTELRELVQEQTETARAEWTRLKDLNCMLPVDDVLAVVGSFLGRIRERIPDRGTRQIIQQEWNAVVASRCPARKVVPVNEEVTSDASNGTGPAPGAGQGAVLARPILTDQQRADLARLDEASLD
jgi:hypothetical protein